MLNIPMARKVLDHVTAHPEEFDMQVWGVLNIRHADGTEVNCGTAACLAGWVCLLDAETTITPTKNETTYLTEDVYAIGRGMLVSVDGQDLDVEARALQVLGADTPELQNRLSDIFNYVLDEDSAIAKFAELIEEAERGELDA